MRIQSPQVDKVQKSSLSSQLENAFGIRKINKQTNKNSHLGRPENALEMTAEFLTSAMPFRDKQESRRARVRGQLVFRPRIKRCILFVFQIRES